VISREHVAIKKPGTVWRQTASRRVIGRRLVRPVAADQVLAAEDIEGLA
jgi:hypothetical protein